VGLRLDEPHHPREPDDRRQGTQGPAAGAEERRVLRPRSRDREYISSKPFVEINWAKGFDPKTGRPIEAPGARWSETGKLFMAAPGPGRRPCLACDVLQPEDRPRLHPGAGPVAGYLAETGRKVSKYTFNIGYDFQKGSLPQVAAIKAAVKKTFVGHLAAWIRSHRRKSGASSTPGPGRAASCRRTATSCSRARRWRVHRVQRRQGPEAVVGADPDRRRRGAGHV